jgi:hypothetical protein
MMKQLFDDEKAKKNPMGDDTKYSRAIRVPQYEPSSEMPSLNELYDVTKYSKLVAKINKSGVSDEEKKFLKFAASRHIVFTYSKIADYYAHANKEMQELMEESALVILDMDDAIANGYVALTEKMQQLIAEEKERDAKAKEAKMVLKEQQKLMAEKLKEEENKEEKQKKKEEYEKVVEAVTEDELPEETEDED